LCFGAKIVDFESVAAGTVDVGRFGTVERRFAIGRAELEGSFVGIVVEVVVAGYCLDWHEGSVQIDRAVGKATDVGTMYVFDRDLGVEIAAWAALAHVVFADQHCRQKFVYYVLEDC